MEPPVDHKSLERELHDRLRSADATTSETSNRRFYALNRASVAFGLNWLEERVVRGTCDRLLLR